jgi:hypothetical protein
MTVTAHPATTNPAIAAASILEQIKADLDAGCPDGRQVACTVEAQLGTALLALRMLADRIAAGAVYETPAAPVERDELVDESPALYAHTADQLAARDDAVWRAGWAVLDVNTLVQA